MPDTLILNPEVPTEIKDAAESGMLVVFIGAGISRLVGCPSWDEFANQVLDKLTPQYLNYHEKSLIEAIHDPRKRLSIARSIEKRNKDPVDYKDLLKGDGSEDSIYKHINNFRCTFVTTNYDLLIEPNMDKLRDENFWRFYKCKDLANDKLDGQGNVIHLHGCVKNPENMVIATKDYLEHYSDKGVQEFLHHLFKNKIVLFLGYGLEEFEILEYIFKYGDIKESVKSTRENRFFMLQGFFSTEKSFYNILKHYYMDSFYVELIGFKKDKKNHKQQIDILKNWVNKLIFEPLALSDEAKYMLEELDD